MSEVEITNNTVVSGEMQIPQNNQGDNLMPEMNPNNSGNIIQTSQRHDRIMNNVSCYLMGCWPILGFMLFGLIPLAISIWLGFQTLDGRLNFTAAVPVEHLFDNFAHIFTDPLFGKAVVNTLISLLSLPLQMVIGFLIAYLLTQNDIKGKTVFRALFFIPYITSAVAVTFVFQNMFDTTYGIVNAIFNSNVDFFNSEFWFMFIMIFIMVWTGTGFYIILYQAALTSVNQSTLEAASIDGASQLKKISAIIIPAVSPTTFYLLVTGIIGGLQNFTWFQIICTPMYRQWGEFGPNNRGMTLVYYIYTYAFSSDIHIQGGYAAAAAIVLSLAILAVTIFNFTMSKKWVHYD